MLPVAIPPGLLAAVSAAAAVALKGPVGLAAAAVAVLSGIATVVGILFGVKYKVAHAVEVRAREGEAALNEALEDRIRTIAHERDELKAKLEEVTETLVRAQQTIARLEALPNLERVLELVSGTFERIRDRLDEMHEENRQLGDERTQLILRAIDDRRAA